MITEDYCSYEVAKLLKEKGFHVPIHTFYNPNKKNYGVKLDPCLIDRNASACVSAPTHQMACAWLREEKHIIIVVQPEYFNSGSECSYWGVDIWIDDNYEKLQGDFPTFEQAVEAALKYCLTNLI